MEQPSILVGPVCDLAYHKNSLLQTSHYYSVLRSHARTETGEIPLRIVTTQGTVVKQDATNFSFRNKPQEIHLDTWITFRVSVDEFGAAEVDSYRMIEQPNFMLEDAFDFKHCPKPTVFIGSITGQLGYDFLMDVHPQDQQRTVYLLRPDLSGTIIADWETLRHAYARDSFQIDDIKYFASIECARKAETLPRGVHFLGVCVEQDSHYFTPVYIRPLEHKPPTSRKGEYPMAIQQKQERRPRPTTIIGRIFLNELSPTAEWIIPVTHMQCADTRIWPSSITLIEGEDYPLGEVGEIIICASQLQDINDASKLTSGAIVQCAIEEVQMGRKFRGTRIQILDEQTAQYDPYSPLYTLQQQGNLAPTFLIGQIEQEKGPPSIRPSSIIDEEGNIPQNVSCVNFENPQEPKTVLLEHISLTPSASSCINPQTRNNLKNGMWVKFLVAYITTTNANMTSTYSIMLCQQTDRPIPQTRQFAITSGTSPQPPPSGVDFFQTGGGAPLDIGTSLATLIARQWNFPANVHQEVKLVGTGGMAHVYQVILTMQSARIHPHMEMNGIPPIPEIRVEYAIKVLQPHLAAYPELVEQFIREFVITRSLLPHNHIAEVYNLISLNNIPAYTMECYPQTLHDYMGRCDKNGMHFKEIVHVFTKILDAIGFAHTPIGGDHPRNPILHRDIKPPNIMLDKSGNVRISDFGIAKVFSGGTTMATISQTGYPGTPLYMAPEQAGQVEKKIGPHSDIYALGVLLLHMLTGTPRPDRIPLIEIRPDIASVFDLQQLENLLRDTMRNDPDARIPSVPILQKRFKAAVTLPRL